MQSHFLFERLPLEAKFQGRVTLIWTGLWWTSHPYRKAGLLVPSRDIPGISSPHTSQGDTTLYINTTWLEVRAYEYDSPNDIHHFFFTKWISAGSEGGSECYDFFLPGRHSSQTDRLRQKPHHCDKIFSWLQNEAVWHFQDEVSVDFSMLPLFCKVSCTD